jgi:hypothetical protein
MDPLRACCVSSGGFKMSTTTKSILAAAALLGALLLLSGATEERLNIRSPDQNCPMFASPNSESACLDDGARPSRPGKKVYFAAGTSQQLAIIAFA